MMVEIDMIWVARITLLGILLAWLLALVKAIRNYLHPKWVLPASAPKAPKKILVSVVIPARNEERNIGNCVQSVMEQSHEKLQIIVMNDGSTDGTGEILQELQEKEERLLVLEGEGGALPEGWFGKPWALQRAQRHATGEWLLFIDADVVLSPEAIACTVQYAIQQELDMVTGLGELDNRGFWEKVLQPVVGGLILAGNSLTAVNDPNRPERNLANGQFILISRQAYDKIGRHTAVKDNILDDIGLARALVAHNLRYHCLHLDQLFRCRMYTSFAEIWEGWTKNMFAGLQYSIPNVIIAIVFTFAFSILGHVLFLLGIYKLVSVEMMLWGTGIMVLCQAVRLVMDWRKGMNMLYGLTHAPANVLVIGILLHSMIRSVRGTVTWKGRTYQPKQ